MHFKSVAASVVALLAGVWFYHDLSVNLRTAEKPFPWVQAGAVTGATLFALYAASEDEE